jgi:hypothetical protein
METPTGKRTEKSGNSSSGQGGGGQDKQHGSNPFQATSRNKDSAGNNPNQPSAFKGADLKQLKEKLNGVTLTDIVIEAGIQGGPSCLNTNGWPNKACLNWVCMGACKTLDCLNDHPTSVDNTTAVTVYKQLEPGIKRLLETNKRPKRN